MLKVAMISGWHPHARGYAETFNALADAKITVVWDEDEERGQALAREFGVPFEPNYGAVLQRDDVDAVSICCPTSMHKDVMIPAARAGKHIFTEKVLAITVEDAEEIRKEVNAAGVKFLISFPHRCEPYNLFAKEVIDNGVLGQITLLRMRNAHNASVAGWLPEHFYDRATCGGGAMMDLGAHPMYLINWLMGFPGEAVSVFTSVTGHAVEDNAVTVFKFDGGAIAVSETGFVTPCPSELEIYGTNGTLIINNGGVRLWAERFHKGERYNDSVIGWITPDHLPKRLPNPVEMFADAVLRGAEIEFNIDAAVNLTKFMAAAYKAADSGHVSKF